MTTATPSSFSADGAPNPPPAPVTTRSHLLHVEIGPRLAGALSLAVVAAFCLGLALGCAP